jgi:flavin reductase (DIM6/NTAB) family NADH-FMN oxidoreductase RutF
MTDLPAKPISADVTSGFRSLMAQFPTGVAVVTSADDDNRPWGMTCSSLCSVTLEPPTLLVCLRQGSPTLAAMLDRKTFAVNLLHAGAQPVAELFASGTPCRFDLIAWDFGPSAGGPHLHQAAHAIADCQISNVEPVGDHLVVFGEAYQVTVEQASPERRSPLLYGRRQFRSWPNH